MLKTISTSRTTVPKTVDDSGPVPWKCKACGAHLGIIKKNNRDWHYLIPSSAPHIHIFGNAKITCQICGTRRSWDWDETVINQLVYNIKRRKRRV